MTELSEGGDNKARGLHSSLLKWDFVTTVILQHVFECTHRSLVYHQVSILCFIPNNRVANKIINKEFTIA